MGAERRNRKSKEKNGFISEIRPEPWNKWDSINIVAILLGVLFVIILPPFWLKVPMFLLVSYGFVALALRSHWTSARPKYIRATIAVVAIVLLCIIAIPQFAAQWRIEHPKKTVGGDFLKPMAVEVGFINVPEHKRLSFTWNGEGWNEALYADVRLTLNNTSNHPIKDLDISLVIPDSDKDSLIAGIGSLEEVRDLRFQAPRLPEMQMRFVGKDGKVYNDLISPGKAWLPSKRIRVFCPDLIPQEQLRLILACLRNDSQRLSPKQIRIVGSFETAPSEGSNRIEVDEMIDVDGRTHLKTTQH